MKAVLIRNTVFETDGSGTAVPKLTGGLNYTVNEATERQVALNNGELIDVPDDELLADMPAPETETPEGETTATEAGTEGLGGETSTEPVATKPARTGKAAKA